MSSAICPSRIHAADAPVEAVSVHQHASWSPYDMNGGTVLAIAGNDYCIVAGSTRLSTGYSILTRNQSKLNQLSTRCVMASGGFQADVSALAKRLKVRQYVNVTTTQSLFFTAFHSSFPIELT